MTTYETLTSTLADIPFLPVIRTGSQSDALAAVTALCEGGIDVIEITATIDGWREVIAQVRAEHPGVLVAAGTIVDAAGARDAIALGVDFIVSPGSFPAVTTAAEKASIPFVPGILTPTELFSTPQHGLVKLFPASLGGPGYLTGLLALNPGVGVIPTGGIRAKDIPAWKQAGALAAGMGVKSAAQATEILTDIAGA